MKEMTQTITKKMVEDGLAKGDIKLIADPNMGHGTVAKIGSSWFYFGGEKAGRLDPDRYWKTTRSKQIAEEIFGALEQFRKIDVFQDEYGYYGAVLGEKPTEVKKEVLVRMQLREGETEEEAENRLFNALYDGLCNNAEHQIEFEYIG